MDDRGEKIVFLARELLDAGVPQPEIKKKTISVTMTLKTLCFTTLLAAAGGTVSSTVVYEQSRPLNRYEKIELQALVFYIAKLKGIQEEIVKQEVERQSGVISLDDISAGELPSVRVLLQEKIAHMRSVEAK